MLFVLLTFLYFFNNETEEKIIEKALRYAPPELKTIIEDNFEEFKKGIEEGRKTNTKFEETEKNVKELSKFFKERKPISKFIFELGKVSSQSLRITYTLELPEERVYDHIKKDFPLYLEKKIKKFPVVFYGFSKDFFKGNIKSFLEGETKDKKEYVILLKNGYLKGEILLSRHNFDDRSNAFGIGQIFTNKSFSLILNIWYYIWIKNGGRWVPLKPHQTNNKLWVLEYGY